jgi:hypothetical protein
MRRVQIGAREKVSANSAETGTKEKPRSSHPDLWNSYSAPQRLIGTFSLEGVPQRL